jgi:hypothetical protein
MTNCSSSTTQQASNSNITDPRVDYGEYVMWRNREDRRGMDTYQTHSDLNDTIAVGMQRAGGMRRELSAPHASGSTPPAVFTQPHEDNTFVVPASLRIGNQLQMPQPRGDLLSFEVQRREDISAQLGIPMVMLIKSGSQKGGIISQSSAVDDNDLHLASRTIGYWKKELLKILGVVYAEMLRMQTPDMEFSLKTVPFVTSEAVHQMYDQDVIDTATFKETLVAIHGMDPSYIARGKVTHTRAAVGRPAADTVTDLMASRKRKLDAEVQELKTESTEKTALATNIDKSTQVMDAELKAGPTAADSTTDGGHTAKKRKKDDSTRVRATEKSSAAHH